MKTRFLLPSSIFTILVLSMAALAFVRTPVHSHAQTITPNPPTATVWYFAEGSVGGGFHEYLTVENPSAPGTTTADISIQYLIQGVSAPVDISHTVAPASRATFDVNNDLGLSVNGTHKSLSAIVTSSNGVGVVVERPLYFTNVQGVASGTDVLGATDPLGTSYYFSEADSRQDNTTSSHYNTFLTMLNPSATLTDTVKITYLTGACSPAGGAPACLTETLSMTPESRATAAPMDVSVGLHQKLAIMVTSNNPVVVERPMYFSDVIPNAGGLTTGAASQVGAIAPNKDWQFAEGSTQAGFQEYFELANFSASQTTAHIKLLYTNGGTQTQDVLVPGYGFTEFDVNAHPGATESVAASIHSSAAIVADRLMYFHFGPSHISGGTDVVGMPGTMPPNNYAFAEGYTGGQFNEFLTLQNPSTMTDATAQVSYFTAGATHTDSVLVPKQSRVTINVNAVVPNASVSILVTSNQSIVAERPQYFLFAGSPGGTDVIGYTGN